MPLLSVIIPIYNGSRYLSETIDMILKSEYKDLEIIAVNDGSTDNSAELVSDFQKKDERVRLFTKENGGVISSRNYGVEHASGDYIAFADQDDFVKPFMYSKIISRMIEDNSEIGICSSGRNVDGSESGFDIQKNELYAGEEIRSELLFPMLFNGYDVPIKQAGGSHYPHIWNCVFRKDFWDKAGLRFRAYINYEDDLLVKTEALSKAERVSTIEDIGYLWRVNLKSETYAHHFVENIGRKQDLEYSDMLSSLKAFDPSEDVLRLFKQIKYCKQYLDAIHFLTSPEIKKDRKFIKEYYKDNIYCRDFEECIEGRKYLRKGMIKPGILLPMLSKRKTMGSYRMEIFLDRVLLFSLHSKALSSFERSLKKKGNTNASTNV